MLRFPYIAVDGSNETRRVECEPAVEQLGSGISLSPLVSLASAGDEDALAAVLKEKKM